MTSHGTPARDVADGSELGRAGEREDAHRHDVDRGEAGVRSGREAVDEPEAGGADDDPEAVEDELAPRLGQPELRWSPRRCRVSHAWRSRSAEERLAAGPVADDEDGVLLPGVAGRVEQPRTARVGHFQTHQRSLASSGVVSAASLSARPSRSLTSLAIRAARSASVSLVYG